MSLYKLTRISIPVDFNSEMKIFISGLQRTGLEEKQQLGLKIREGKKPMSVEVFEFLAKNLLHSKKKEDIFCHLFLVLDW